MDPRDHVGTMFLRNISHENSIATLTDRKLLSVDQSRLTATVIGLPCHGFEGNPTFLHTTMIRFFN